MVADTLFDLRADARAAGLRWAHVMQAARELRAAEIRQREPLDRARALAWASYCHWAGRAPSCLPFWRCGFDHVLTRLANGGRDYTAIRRYDLIASSVAEHLPEWDDRCDELWEFLATPYEPLPSTASFLPRAFDWLMRNQLVTCDSQLEEF